MAHFEQFEEYALVEASELKEFDTDFGDELQRRLGHSILLQWRIDEALL